MFVAFLKRAGGLERIDRAPWELRNVGNDAGSDRCDGGRWSGLDRKCTVAVHARFAGDENSHGWISLRGADSFLGENAGAVAGGEDEPGEARGLGGDGANHLDRPAVVGAELGLLGVTLALDAHR